MLLMSTKNITLRKFRMSLILLLGMSLSLSSCNGKEDSIRKMEQLSADMNLHSASFTEEDWTEALDKYQELSEELEGEELSPQQLQRFGKVKGEIAGYFANQAGREAGAALRDVLYEAAGFVDGFVNTALPDAKSLQKE